MGHENWPAMFSSADCSDERNEFSFIALLYIDEFQLTVRQHYEVESKITNLRVVFFLT